MASSKIKSDIQRDGFVDKAGSGTTGQVRTLNDSGEEIWQDSSGSNLTADDIVTSGSDKDVTVDNTGNVLQSELEYVGFTNDAPFEDSGDSNFTRDNLIAGNNITLMDSGTENVVIASTDSETISVDGNVVNNPNFIGGDSATYTVNGSDVTLDIGATAANRLEATIINNSGSDIGVFTVRSLEDDVYDEATNTITLTATKTGATTPGQTGVFTVLEAIPNGSTGIALIKGIVGIGINSSFAETFLSVATNNNFNISPVIGDALVGVLLRSPNVSTEVELAFDGLSTSIFSRDGHVIEDSAGTDLTQRPNLRFSGSGVSVSDDSTNDRTDVVITDTDTTYTFENNGIVIPDQEDIDKLNFVGQSVTAIIDPDDQTTLDINLSSIETITELDSRNSSDLVLNREAAGITKTHIYEAGTDHFLGITDPFIQKFGDLLYFPNADGLQVYNLGTDNLSTVNGTQFDDNITGMAFDGTNILFTERPSSNTTGVLYFLDSSGNKTRLDFQINGVNQLNSSIGILKENSTFYVFGLLTPSSNNSTVRIYSFTSSDINTSTGNVEVTIVATGGSLNNTSIRRGSFTKVGNDFYYIIRSSFSQSIRRLTTSNIETNFSFSIDGDSSFELSSIAPNGTNVFFSAYNINGFNGEGAGIYQLDPSTSTISVVSQTGIPNPPFADDDEYTLRTFLIDGSTTYLYIPNNNINVNLDGIWQIGNETQYNNNIGLDNVLLNPDPTNFNYNSATGLLTINETGTVQITLNFSTINSSVTYTGSDYRIGLTINDVFDSRALVSTIVNGTQNRSFSFSYNATAGDTIQFREFIPVTADFESQVTTIPIGAQFRITNTQEINIQRTRLAFTTSDFSSGTLTLQHDLNNSNINGFFKNTTTNVINYFPITIVDDNNISITETAFEGIAFLETR